MGEGGGENNKLLVGEGYCKHSQQQTPGSSPPVSMTTWDVCVGLSLSCDWMFNSSNKNSISTALHMVLSTAHSKAKMFDRHLFLSNKLTKMGLQGVQETFSILILFVSFY